MHEEVVRGSLDELATWAADGVLGEITVVLAGATPRADLPSLVAEVQELVAGGVRVKDACSQVAAAHPDVRSRQLYDAVLRSRGELSAGRAGPLADPACTVCRCGGSSGDPAAAAGGADRGERELAAAVAGRRHAGSGGRAGRPATGGGGYLG